MEVSPSPVGRFYATCKISPENNMPSQAELDAAFNAVRALVNARAGWYAGMISDDMIKDVVLDALTAAQKVRSGQPPAIEPSKS
jgi:hypothetical protein